MQIIHSPHDMQQCALALRREGRRTVFVPTMGYLHEAHLSLVRLARQRGDVTVVSIFVNPTQFGPGEDYTRYPRDTERDLEACRKEGADIVFVPSVDTMYDEDPCVFVDEDSVSRTFEGASRPGHFRGVLTVVLKLLNLVLPDVAVFGEKDAQQLYMVRRMVRDLKVPVEIIAGPLVRETDGLAMSSRNVYLSTEERRDALLLHKALQQADALVRAGEEKAAVLKAAVAETFAGADHAKLDYVEVVDDATFQPVDPVWAGCRMVLAARVGAPRLLDNMRLGASDEP